MPVLNGGKFMDVAIRSIRSQSFHDWHLVIRDGGSEDGSLELAQKHADQESRISLDQTGDDGQYDAIRQGLDRGAGDILAWLNADDIYSPWAFETVDRFLREEGRRWVTGLPAHWDSLGNLVAVAPVGRYYRRLIHSGWYHDGLLGCIQQESTFFHATLWNELGTDRKRCFADCRLAGDFYLWTQFARKERLEVLATVLGGYRVHGKNRAIAHATAYHDEVMACGGAALPRPLARIARSVNDRMVASAALTRFREAALRLHTTLSGS